MRRLGDFGSGETSMVRPLARNTEDDGGEHGYADGQPPPTVPNKHNLCDVGNGRIDTCETDEEDPRRQINSLECRPQQCNYHP